MSILIVGLVVFIGIHLLPAFVVTRQACIAKFGANTYKGLFSLLSLLGLILIGVGKSQATFVSLLQPPAWGQQVALVLMALASILMVAAYTPSNVKRLTRHPMLWSVALWSAAHLLANGDLASVVMFGAVGLYALIAMLSANWRGASKQIESRPLSNDLVTVVAGLALFATLLFLHPYAFGMAVV